MVASLTKVKILLPLEFFYFLFSNNVTLLNISAYKSNQIEPDRTPSHRRCHVGPKFNTYVIPGQWPSIVWKFSDLHGCPVPEPGCRHVPRQRTSAAHFQTVRCHHTRPWGHQDTAKVSLRVPVAVGTGQPFPRWTFQTAYLSLTSKRCKRWQPFMARPDYVLGILGTKLLSKYVFVFSCSSSL